MLTVPSFSFPLIAGENVTIKSFSLYDLIPDLSSYLTYEGSLTIPGCYETVTWIIVNKPVFITRQQVSHSGRFSWVFNAFCGSKR